MDGEIDSLYIAKDIQMVTEREVLLEGTQDSPSKQLMPEKDS